MAQPAQQENHLEELQQPRVLEDARVAQVIWARVKGYPHWPVRAFQQQQTACQPACLYVLGVCKVLHACHWLGCTGRAETMHLQAQVLSEAAAAKKLGKITHRKALGVPVMFFGTLELACVGLGRHSCPWAAPDPGSLCSCSKCNGSRSMYRG
jgi:hypothetical protein